MRLLLLILWSVSIQAHSAASQDAILKGRDLFVLYCTGCHGLDASGGSGSQGVIGADLTKISQRRDGVWPMLEVMSIIDGYTRSSTESERMPVITALTEGPVVNFDTGNGETRQVPARLVAIARYLESIQFPIPQRYVP